MSGKTFYANNLTKQTGTLALSGNATAADVVSGKTFYSNNAKSKLTGTMGTMAGGTYTPSDSEQTISCSGKKMTSNIIIAPMPYAYRRVEFPHVDVANTRRYRLTYGYNKTMIDNLTTVSVPLDSNICSPLLNVICVFEEYWNLGGVWYWGNVFCTNYKNTLYTSYYLGSKGYMDVVKVELRESSTGWYLLYQPITPNVFDDATGGMPDAEIKIKLRCILYR